MLRNFWYSIVDAVWRIFPWDDDYADRLWIDGICLATVIRAKALGACEYVYVEMGPPSPEGGDGESLGTKLRAIADEKWPGAMFDTEQSDFKTGRMALLLPSKTYTGELPSLRDFIPPEYVIGTLSRSLIACRLR